MLWCSAGDCGGDVATLLGRVAVAFGAGLHFGCFAVGAALGALGQGSGGGEAQEGFAGAEGFCVVAAAFVDGGEPLVGMAADEALGDALFVEFYGALGVAVTFGPVGLLVSLHGGLEVEEGILLSPDPAALRGVQAVERRGILLGGRFAAEDAPQTFEDQNRSSPYLPASITGLRGARAVL